MKNRKDLENKALELEKRIWELEHSCWIVSDGNRQKADILKSAHTVLMWALDYKPRYA